MTAEQAREWLEYLPAHEPVFVLRARDPLAEYAIIRWVSEAGYSGVSKEKIDGALAVLSAFKKWPVRKMPG